ncbi:hypothetical protein ACSSV1_005396 [Labrenzia sp. MBR-25]|jgi:hypothetical protein
MKFSSIVLLGGTGDVGRRVVKLLSEHTDCRIFLVSRTGGTETDRVRHLKIDLGAEDARKEIPDGAAVVNLTETTPPALSAAVVRKGGVFIDTSASPDYVSALEREISAVEGPGTGILCVGTAPGLSTLLAADLASRTGATLVDVGIELGMGRHYGRAATEWFFHALGTPYCPSGPDRTNSILPGSLQRTFLFGRSGKPQLAVGIGFPDQGIATSGTKTGVRTFLAVDPPLVNRLVGGLLRLGLGPSLARRAGAWTRVTLALPALGGARTRLAVEGFSSNGSRVGSSRLTAGDQADLTAATIVATLLEVGSGDAHRTGLTTISDHMSVEATLTRLRNLLPSMAIDIDTEITSKVNDGAIDRRPARDGVPDDAHPASSLR